MWLKKTAATGYLRNLTSPNRRYQETRREYLLCRDCEQILSRDEKLFAEQVFLPYHENASSVFLYGSWLRRFLAGFHWKILVTRQADQYPDSASAIYVQVQDELRRFLLGESQTPGRAEFHIFFLDAVKDSTHELLPKTNEYLARALDATPTYSDSGSAGVYGKLVKIMTMSFLSARDPQTERWEGTEVFDDGQIRTPQRIETISIGPFLEDRIKAVARASSSLSDKQKKSLLETVRKNPERFLASENVRVHSANGQLQKRLKDREMLRTAISRTMKGRDRNQPCPCGSPMKFKKCCGRV
jgi:hypothetical protein